MPSVPLACHRSVHATDLRQDHAFNCGAIGGATTPRFFEAPSAPLCASGHVAKRLAMAMAAAARRLALSTSTVSGQRSSDGGTKGWCPDMRRNDRLGPWMLRASPPGRCPKGARSGGGAPAAVIASSASACSAASDACKRARESRAAKLAPRCIQTCADERSSAFVRESGRAPSGPTRGRWWQRRLRLGAV